MESLGHKFRLLFTADGFETVQWISASRMRLINNIVKRVFIRVIESSRFLFDMDENQATPFSSNIPKFV